MPWDPPRSRVLARQESGVTACHTGNLQTECSHEIGYFCILMHFSSMSLSSTLKVKISWMQNLSVLSKCPSTVQSCYNIQRNPSKRDPCCPSPWKRKYSAWHGIFLGTGIPSLRKGRVTVNCFDLAISGEKSSCFLCGIWFEILEAS